MYFSVSMDGFELIAKYSRMDIHVSIYRTRALIFSNNKNVLESSKNKCIPHPIKTRTEQFQEIFHVLQTFKNNIYMPKN